MERRQYFGLSPDFATFIVTSWIYQEFLNFNQKDVRLSSTAGAEATILQAPAPGPGVIIGPAGSISGFTIRKPSPLM